MAVVTMRQLLESGVHFGHQTRRWNPKMKRFIFTERNGIYIIDLQQSLTYIDSAYDFIKETVAHGGSVMFIGTKKQAQDAIAEQATRVGMPYVNQRWLGGMLTNFSTVHKRLQRLKELEVIEQTGGAHVTSKKEALMLSVEYPPGGADPVHRHDAHGFIYVLEGSVVMGVKGGKEVTLSPGQTFYEGPKDIHTVGRNASSTQPAKFLVLLIKKKGAEAVLPVK